jgi:hypothetical protein
MKAWLIAKNAGLLGGGISCHEAGSLVAFGLASLAGAACLSFKRAIANQRSFAASGIPPSA